MANSIEERSTADIMQTVVRDMGDMVRAEIRLARAEMTEKAKKAGVGAGLMGGAAVVGLLAGASLTAAAIAALALVLPVWASALIVCVLLACLGGALFAAGRSKFKAVQPVPQRTVQTLKDDVEWAKHQMR
jgi:uncharacterized membrane protein YqjE